MRFWMPLVHIRYKFSFSIVHHEPKKMAPDGLLQLSGATLWGEIPLYQSFFSFVQSWFFLRSSTILANHSTMAGS